MDTYKWDIFTIGSVQMVIPRQYYTEEFKQEAVKLIRELRLNLS